MRSRRHGDAAIIMAKANIKMAKIKKNMRALTPPKNKMPMAMMAITKKAPMSGSANKKIPARATAAPIGRTARKKRSFTSILRTM